MQQYDPSIELDYRNRDIEILHMMFHEGIPYSNIDSGIKYRAILNRTLPGPTLNTGSGVVWATRDGTWQAERLLQPAALVRWGFIVIEPGAPDQADYARIISLIINCGRNMGMTVAQPAVQQFNLQFQDVMDLLVKCKENDIQLLFVVLPASERDYYHKLKQLAELKVGIITQCIKEKTVRKEMNPRIVRSILRKVNAKLMGVNHALDCPPYTYPFCLRNSRRLMVVGAHVIHPTPKQCSSYESKAPSIAAVTASFDSQRVKYNVTMSIQVSKKEEIIDLENMMVEHLNVYSQHNQGFPDSIIFIRNCMPATIDNEVEYNESRALYSAYWRVSLPSWPLHQPETRPNIMYLVVESPGNARLKILNWGREYKCHKNVQPGTVINTHEDRVDFVRQINFSMVSYKAPRTARVTNYFMYHTEGIPYTETERMAYYLCFLNARCTRSMAYPTPLYYARLACRRALSLTYGETYDPDSLEMEPLRLRVHKSLSEHGQMFFV